MAVAGALHGPRHHTIDLSFAMAKLIVPHIDKPLARKSHETWTRTINGRRAKFAKPR
jgi:hypothetical protein